MDGGSSISSAAAAAAAAMSLPLGNFGSSAAAHGLGAASAIAAANPLLMAQSLGHAVPGFATAVAPHSTNPTTSALDVSAVMNPTSVAAPTQGPGLAFPPSRPVLHVPHFDNIQFQSVSLNTEPSARQDGSDLPVNSLPTLRFFFNLGVQYAKILALQQAKENNAQNAQASLPNFLSLLQNQQAAAAAAASDPLNGFLNAAQQQQILRNQANLLAAGKLPQLPGVGAGATLLQQQILQQLQKSALLQQQHHQQQQQQRAAAGNPVENNMLQYALSQHYNRAEGANAFNDLTQLQRLQAANTNAALLNAAAQSSQHPFSELMKPSVLNAASAATHGGIPPVTAAAPTSTTTNEEIFKKRQELLQQRHQEALRKASITSNSDQEALQKALMSSFCAANNIPPTSAHALVPRSQVDQTQISIVAAIEQQQAALQSSVAALHKTPVTSPPSTSATGDSSASASTSSSAEITTSNAFFTSAEQHYTNAFKKAQQAVSGESQHSTPPTTMSSAAADVTRDVKDTIASIAKGARVAEDGKEFPMGPIMMLPVFNSCFQNVKYSLAHKGYEIGVDDQFRAIDYSSRPVDPIFRKAQQEREKEAHLMNPGFRKSISPQHRVETLKEAELIHQAQQNALRNSCPIGIANPMREKSPIPISVEGGHPAATSSPSRSPLKRESPSETPKNGDSGLDSAQPEIIADSPEEKRLRIASGSDED
ncbi:hypothetical protein QR680_017716 [Steinernema hermaphroditum]|uniref:Uncharacterized protein n=1 Tax=Steinernema hermaphroditum TaxID=289476 RepID=A0AA39HHS7_9BILA|nr:hypothetical protein QR680_017716 [Steinernema hermaphroditum]